MTAGAAPPAAVIEGMERMGFEVTHVYGLTETYGPGTAIWLQRWRLFFLACAVFFAIGGGREWGVAHYLFEKPRSAPHA